MDQFRQGRFSSLLFKTSKTLCETSKLFGDDWRIAGPMDMRPTAVTLLSQLMPANSPSWLNMKSLIEIEQVLFILGLGSNKHVPIVKYFFITTGLNTFWHDLAVEKTIENPINNLKRRKNKKEYHIWANSKAIARPSSSSPSSSSN